ncbi:hypothetical protein F2Q70_00012029 [Brassica cretica]|uniref:Uncharacterized protein n=1 Tax=Brassica cretica TaxID=69181 RepID=A0A8S9M658_BRACR|nr:hypothetical protein F2Q70_00012029 [Brassica cretica]
MITSTPSKRKMSALEHDEDYKEEATIEYLGLAIEEEGVLRRSHETEGKKSIDGDIKISIDTHQGKGPDARATDSTMIDDIPWILPLLYHAFQCHWFEVNQHPIAEVMPVLLESGTSGSREEAVEEMKEIRLTVRPCTVHHGTVQLDTVQPASIDTVHPASIDTVHPPSIDSVHPASNDTVHCDSVHHGTVHPDTVILTLFIQRKTTLLARKQRRSRNSYLRLIKLRSWKTKKVALAIVQNN